MVSTRRVRRQQTTAALFRTWRAHSTRRDASDSENDDDQPSYATGHVMEHADRLITFLSASRRRGQRFEAMIEERTVTTPEATPDVDALFSAWQRSAECRCRATRRPRVRSASSDTVASTAILVSTASSRRSDEDFSHRLSLCRRTAHL